MTHFPARLRALFAHAREGEAIAPILLAIFLTAGVYKGHPTLQALPVDLTLAVAAGLVVVAAFLAIKSPLPLPRAPTLMAMLVVFSFMLPMWRVPQTAYASQKTGFFVLTLLALLFPLIVMRDSASDGPFLWALVIGGLGLSTLILITGGVNIYGRVTALGVNPIMTGRGTGAALTIVTVFAAYSGLRQSKHLVLLAVPLLVVLVGTGTRGPFISVVISVVAALMFHARFGRRGLVKLVMSSLLMLGFLWSALSFAPDEAAARLENVLDHTDTSSQYRVAAWSESLEVIQVAPAGIGWGAFDQVIILPASQNEMMVYPHNMILEVFLEGGWLAGLALLLLLGWGLWGLAITVNSSTSAAMFALAVFALLNSLLTGDINGNRLALSLAMVGIVRLAAHRPIQGADGGGWRASRATESPRLL